VIFEHHPRGPRKATLVTKGDLGQSEAAVSLRAFQRPHSYAREAELSQRAGCLYTPKGVVIFCGHALSEIYFKMLIPQQV